ncbi:MAG: helix-turn-helix domain-containing protein [Candidatus Dormibacteraceae bacterium]
MIDDYVSVEEAAKASRRTPETVRRWIRAGGLPASRRGNRLLIKRQDWERLQTSNSQMLSLAEWSEKYSKQLWTSRGPIEPASDLLLEDRWDRSHTNRWNR